MEDDDLDFGTKRSKVSERSLYQFTFEAKGKSTLKCKILSSVFV